MFNNKRFVKIHKENGLKIVLDTETGVNYLIYEGGYAGGITPLLDENGKPVVTPKDEMYKYLR